MINITLVNILMVLSILPLAEQQGEIDAKAASAMRLASLVEFAPSTSRCDPAIVDRTSMITAALDLDDIKILLDSPDAHARGVAIFVASDRQYFDLLLQHPQLADDRRPSIPNLICTPHRELPPAQVPKTVQARYLDSIQFWFGTSGSTSERQSALFPPDVPASRYAHPWTRRIELAVRADGKTKVALRNEVRSLPSDLRWVVLSTSLPVEGVRELFTEAEIREEMKRLDNETARAILSGTAKLPPDPQYQKPNAGEGLMRVAEALINDKPVPDPYDSLPEHIKKMIVDR